MNVHITIFIGSLMQTGILTYCCSCYVFGKTAEAVGEDCCLCCLAFCSPFILIARLHVRERIRQKKDLRVSNLQLIASIELNFSILVATNIILFFIPINAGYLWH